MSEPDTLITLKDVFTMVTKLVGHMEAVDTRNLHADEIHHDHEIRMRGLERWRYSLPASMLISAGSTAIAIIALFRH